jgi:hypothetical protein
MTNTITLAIFLLLAASICESALIQCRRVRQLECGTGSVGLDYCDEVACMTGHSIHRCRGRSGVDIATAVASITDETCRTLVARVMCETTFPTCNPNNTMLVLPRMLCFRSCVDALSSCIGPTVQTYCRTEMGPAISPEAAQPPSCIDIRSFGDDYCAENNT